MMSKKSEVLEEMVNYVLPQKGISYYDLKNYAYENDKQDWIAVLNDRKSRHFLSVLLRSKRREDRVPYNNSFGETRRGLE